MTTQAVSDEKPDPQEEQKSEDAPVEKMTFPPEIELTELEALKLTAVSATAGKIIAESRFMQLQAQTIQRQLQENQSSLMSVAEEEKAIMAEIAQRLGLPHVAQYRMDPAQRKGMLQRPTPARGPASPH
jgi:hypothetical protein